MSNTDILKSAYEAFGKGDIPAVLAAFQDDIVWTTIDVGKVNGTRKGKDDVLAFFGDLPVVYEPFAVSPEEFIADGDTVVVVGHHDYATESVPFAHVWRMRDGKVASFNEYVDGQALLAHQV